MASWFKLKHYYIVILILMITPSIFADISDNQADTSNHFPKLEFCVSTGIVWLSQFKMTCFLNEWFYIQPRFSTILFAYDKGIAIGYQKYLGSSARVKSFIRFEAGYSVGDYAIISPEPVDIVTKWKGLFLSVGAVHYSLKHPRLGLDVNYNMIFRNNADPVPSMNIGFNYMIFDRKK
jgi:hypothetical protein